MRAILLAALLALPLLPLGAAQESDPAWSDAHPFRIALKLDEPEEPLAGRPVALARESLVLVPLDVTGALRRGGTWPVDASGRPLAWTFAPESVRVLLPGSEAAIPAKFLPYSLDATAGEYDASANAFGTLAILLPAGAREVEVYFDIVENAPGPHASSPGSDARLDEVAGLGPMVATIAHVPRTPTGATPALVVLSPDGAARVLVERLRSGAAPAVLGEVEASLLAEIPLPATEDGYDIMVTSDRPVLAFLRTAAGAAGAFFHPATDGSAAGREFLLAAAGRVEIIGTRSATQVHVQDARSGSAIASVTLGRLATHSFEVPSGAVLRVTGSAPLLALQHASNAGGSDAFLHAGRALAGGATGTLVLAARGAGHSVVSVEPATVQAFPVSSPQTVTSARAGEAERPAWVSRGAAVPATDAWAYSSSSDLTVLTGSDGYAAMPGAGARAFVAPLATSRDPARPSEAPLMARVLVPFDGTRVDAERLGFDGRPLASGTIDAGARVALTTIPGSDADLGEEGAILRVASSKPTFVTLFRPGAPALAPVPGLPPVMKPLSAKLEHHGAILAWAPLASFVDLRAGETGRATLTLANLGRTRTGEGIVEDVELEARPIRSARCRAEWEVALPEARLEKLAAPGQRAVEVAIVLPATAIAGECMEVELRATASSDPTVDAKARVSVRARSGFEPELRIFQPDGSRATGVSLTLEPGAPASIELRIKNVGGENGTALLRHLKGPGYESALSATPRGAPVERISLAGGEERTLWLDVRAPTGVEPPWDFLVQATSAADPSARDEVVVSVTPRTVLDLLASAPDRRLQLAPGSTVATRVNVTNLGADVEVRARAATTLPAGWNVTITPERALLRAAGSRGDLGEALDRAQLLLEVRAPQNATVGATLPLAIALASSGSEVRVPLLLLVTNDLRLEVTPPSAVVAGPRDAGVAVVTLRSLAAGPMNVSVRSLGTPSGWTATATEAVLMMRPGEEHRLAIRYEVAPDARAGAGALALALKLEDASTPARIVEANVSVRTIERASLELTRSPARVVLAPGELAPVLFQLRNGGNAPSTLDARTEGPLALSTSLPAALLPGGSLTIAALVGPGSGTAALEFGDARATIEVVGAVRDVRLASATGRGSLLDVVIENRGTIASGPLAIDVLANGQRIATLPIPEIPPGSNASHAIVTPLGALTVVVEVRSVEGVPDATPDDNAFRVRGPDPLAAPGPDGVIAAAKRAVPAPALAIGGVIAVVLLRRQRA